MSAPVATQSTDPIPHSVAETLSVTTDGPSAHEVTVTQSALPVPASSIPSVGASISVPDSGSGASLVADRSSGALLSLASSCSLTEILNAQQQALEQFQCQLQLAQQTEAINQRLDAIERTLNSLIQQRAQEEAVKNAAAAAAAAAVVNGTSQVNTPLRPSQQLQLPPMNDDSPGTDGKKKKLPRELCSKVRSTYNSIGLEFKIDERFLSPSNQRVTDTLIDQIYTDSNGCYNVKDIKRAVHRYYESRRRIGIEEMPDRQEKAAEQKKKRKYRARQQRSYDRRKKFVRETEMRYWQAVTPGCMTEESDSETSDKIVTHRLLWRSEFLNQFMEKLDARYERSRKPGPGVSASARRERVEGHASSSSPPSGLPAWMINPTYRHDSILSQNSSMHLVPTSMTEAGDNMITAAAVAAASAALVSTPTVAETTTVTDDVSYSMMNMHDVPDDTSDFELPESVTADTL